MAPAYPFIALEALFFSTATDSTGTLNELYSEQFEHVSGLHEKLTDLSSTRTQHTDSTNCAIQIVSHAPGKLPADA